MTASLPMYDRAETEAANDRLWSEIRARLRRIGIAAPEMLNRDLPERMPHWLSPDLVFSQTCGFPYRAKLFRHVTLIGTPDYGVEGCPPGYYRSVFVVRADDPRSTLQAFDGARFAYNDGLSQSGWAAPQTHIEGLGLTLPATLCSGAHRLSARAVLEGRADLAALDAVTWRMLSRWEPEMAGLRVLALTEPTPGLPYITAKGNDAEAFFSVTAEAIAALSQADRDLLGLRGLVRIAPETYLSVPTPAAVAPEPLAV